MWEENIPLLPDERTIEWEASRRKVFFLRCPLATTGMHASSFWLLALPACCLPGAGRGGREREREGGSWCPALPGWQISGSPVMLFLQFPPFSSSLCPWSVSPSLPAVPL